MDLPIIIVPGIFGTRLVNSRGRSIWDPDEGKTFSNARGLLTLMDMGDAAIPNPRASRTVRRELRGLNVVNAGHLVWRLAYDRLVRELASPGFRVSCASRVRVYACGYDWRRTNFIAANKLSHVVHRALSETGAPKAIIVAHSMGGIVSRIFMRYGRIFGRPASTRIARLILLGSPTHGASKTYRFLRQSFSSPDEVPVIADLSDISDIDLGEYGDHLTDGLGQHAARLLRRFHSPYEVLPTLDFCRSNPNWVRFDTRRARMRDASSPRTLYTNRWTGINPTAIGMRLHLSLEARLGKYLPSQTTIMYSSEVRTNTNFRIDSDGSLRNAGARSTNMGDGTVPVFSASAAANRAIGRRIDMRNINHGGLAQHPRAVARIKSLIQRECGVHDSEQYDPYRSIA